jgi:hypothetical protein
MRNGKWLKAQKLLPQLSPQTTNLFNFGKKASFGRKESGYVIYLKLGEMNGTIAIVNSHRPLARYIFGMAIFFQP